MEAHPRPLKSVFRSDVRLTVPLFQRAYVWNAADQWIPLWQDIQATERRFSHGDTSPHFLGAVVLQQKPASLGSLEVREVIDGQQRLTTLQLFIVALRDIATAQHDDGRLARRLSKLIKNDPDLVEQPEQAFKLWPTNRDRAAYQAVLQGDHVDSPYVSGQARPVQAYAWFKDHIAGWIGKQESGQIGESLSRLADVVTDGLVTVVIDLTTDDDAQVIFETLNARGTPLLASDLVKNLLFRTLETAGEPVEALYERYWRPLEGKVWEKEIRQGRLKRARLDAFMNYFLVTFLQQEVQAHDIFSTVRGFVGADAQRAIALLEAIGSYSAVYLDVDEGVAGDEIEQAILRRLRIADSQTVTPLLMWLFSHTDGEERLGALTALESFIVRRAICGWSTANYNRIFLEILRRLGAGGGSVDKIVRDHLASLSTGSGYWPTDENVIDELASRQLYLRLKQVPLRLLLDTLDSHIASNRTESTPSIRKLTIEHLLPQEWTQNWPLPETLDHAERLQLSGDRNALLHTLGNLTLVTGSSNSSMSNSAWPIKQKYLLEFSALTLNRRLPDTWDVDEIRGRNGYLAQIVCEIWPRPMLADAGPLRVEDERAGADELAIAGVQHASAGGPEKRGDIAAHIAFVFANRQPGEFMTISAIGKIISPHYPDSPPSQGAISARLFPSGRESTVLGVNPDRRDGVRGATKI